MYSYLHHEASTYIAITWRGSRLPGSLRTSMSDDDSDGTDHPLEEYEESADAWREQQQAGGSDAQAAPAPVPAPAPNATPTPASPKVIYDEESFKKGPYKLFYAPSDLLLLLFRSTKGFSMLIKCRRYISASTRTL